MVWPSPTLLPRNPETLNFREVTSCSSSCDPFVRRHCYAPRKNHRIRALGPVGENTSIIVHIERNDTISKEEAGIANFFCDHQSQLPIHCLPTQCLRDRNAS